MIRTLLLLVIAAAVTGCGEGVISDPEPDGDKNVEQTQSGLTANFETGTDGWSMTGLWHTVYDSNCANPGYSSPNRAMYFGQDSSCNYATGSRATGDLTSPPIQGLTAGSELTFDYYRQVESYGGSYDRSEVAVAEDGSTTWQQVWFKDSRNASENSWISSGSIGLSDYAGKTVRLRFRFDSVDGLYNGYKGWLIDDVLVSGTDGGEGEAPSVCGNGIPEAGEFCDDGNLSSCDGCSANCLVIEALVAWYPDADEDGFGDRRASAQQAYCAPTGMVAGKTDCNDINPQAHPGHTELCGDGADNDCDGRHGGCEDCQWTNPVRREDINGDGFVSPGDGLAIINHLNSVGAGPPPGPGGGPPYLDVDCDGYIAPVDVLYVINYLNEPPAEPSCGDWILGWNESCDDGNSAACDGCDGCQVETMRNWYPDADQDGYGDRAAPGVVALCRPDDKLGDNSDCNDASATINPGAEDPCGDSVDQNCDGADPACPCDHHGYACSPFSCGAFPGVECGAVPDGCGGLLTCGYCQQPQTCGGGGVPNWCD